MKEIRGYQIIEHIGEGGFAEVYRAHQPTINRDVAIKVIKPEYVNQPDFVRKFKQEATLVGGLEHPNIIPLYDFWHDESGAYLVMRWIKGGSLRDYLSSHHADLDMVRHWIEQIAQALHTAHKIGIIHRDIKPDNVLLDQDHNAYLADFGIAKNIAISPTGKTENPLTPLYAAPEQFANESITPATDIYALGIMTYEMLQGEPPFAGSLTQLVFSHMNDELPPFSQSNYAIPHMIHDVLIKATSKLPEDRYQTVLELLQDFQSAFEVQAQPIIETHHVASGTNPFFNRGPIRDQAYFWGRDNEVRQLESLIRNGQSVSIIGQRRIGKTSLLYNIFDDNQNRVRQGATDEPLFIFLDCGALITMDPPEIYRTILEEIEDTLFDMGTDIEISALQNDSPLSYRNFERSLRQLFRMQSQLVLMMDEFELLSRNSHLDSEFFTGLRALAMRHPITYVTASRDPLLNLTYADESALSSPFFNIFAVIRLGLFTEDIVLEMVSTLSTQASQTFPYELIDSIFIMSGGHPLFTQIAAYHAFELERSQASDLYTLERMFRDSINPHLDYYWRSLTSDEQRVLLTLQSSRFKDVEIVRELQSACLVRETQDGDILLLSPILKDYIHKQHVAGFLMAGEILIDEARREILCSEQVIEVTPTQFDLLRIFLTQVDQILTTEDLEQTLWTDAFVEDPERLKSVIKGLRRALGNCADHIENVRGVGYRWRLER